MGSRVGLCLYCRGWVVFVGGLFQCVDEGFCNG